MKLDAYSILDEKSGTYDRPIFATTHAVAMRAFGDACKDPNHPMAKHPEDYRLYHLGDFNQVTGEMRKIVHGLQERHGGERHTFNGKRLRCRPDGEYTSTWVYRRKGKTNYECKEHGTRARREWGNAPLCSKCQKPMENKGMIYRPGKA